MTAMLRPSRPLKPGVLLFLHFSGVVAVGIVILGSRWIRWVLGDARLAYVKTLHLMLGQLPYRDFPMEYPPLAILSFYLPQLAGFGMPLTWRAYLYGVFIMNALLSVVLSLVLWRLTTQARCGVSPVSAVGVYALMAIILTPLMCWRYDLLPALLTLLTLQAVLGKRALLGGVWLGLGVMVRLYPIVLLPVFLLYYFMAQRRQEMKILIAGLAIPLVLTILPFARVPLPVFLSFLTYHRQRGLEFEALPAGLLMLAHKLAGMPVHIVWNFMAFHLVSPPASFILKCLPVIFLLSFGGLLIRASREFGQEQTTRGAITTETLIRFVTAALALFIVANKVLSPQYVIWLLPFAPLLRPRERHMLLVTAALTILLFPFLFNSLLTMNTITILLLNLRNFLLVMLLCSLLGLRFPVWNAIAPLRRKQAVCAP